MNYVPEFYLTNDVEFVKSSSKKLMKGNRVEKQRNKRFRQVRKRKRSTDSI